MESPFKLESLNTSYVSLAALIRHLREGEFHGRLHVVLDGYEADVFLDGSKSTSVWERDLSNGRESRGEEAQQRLLVRAREPGGSITIFEGTSDQAPVDPAPPEQDAPTEPDSSQLVDLSAEIIAAVERAVNSTGQEFAAFFRRARVELGDDYPFIDPTLGGFKYTNGQVILSADPSPTTFGRAIVACLKRVVDQVAANTGGTSFRERVALELAITARRQTGKLGEFQSHLDRIAGTRVL